VSGSGISWAIGKSAPRPRQITTPAPHHSSFLQAGCPSCRPTNSVKALKAFSAKTLVLIKSFRPKHNTDLKSDFKPKLRLTSVLAKSFRLQTKTFC